MSLRWKTRGNWETLPHLVVSFPTKYVSFQQLPVIFLRFRESGWLCFSLESVKTDIQSWLFLMHVLFCPNKIGEMRLWLVLHHLLLARVLVFLELKFLNNCCLSWNKER